MLRKSRDLGESQSANAAASVFAGSLSMYEAYQPGGSLVGVSMFSAAPEDWNGEADDEDDYGGGDDYEEPSRYLDGGPSHYPDDGDDEDGAGWQGGGGGEPSLSSGRSAPGRSKYEDETGEYLAAVYDMCTETGRDADGYGGPAAGDTVSQFLDGVHRDHVHLRHQGIGPTAVPALARCLATNAHVTSLDFGDNCLGDQGVATLFSALLTNTTLRSLDVSANGAGKTAVAALGQVLKNGCRLQHLNLSDNKLGHALTTKLAASISFCTSLTSLDLSRNALNMQCASGLVTVIKTGHVQLLNLDWNELARSAGDIFTACIDSGIQSLSMRFNGITDATSTQLSNFIRSSKVLKDLNLEHNRFGAVTGHAVAEAALSSGTLRSLRMGYNLIGAEATRAIVSVLARNPALIALGLENTTGDGKDGDAQVQETFEFTQDILSKRESFARVVLEYPEVPRHVRTRVHALQGPAVASKAVWSVKNSIFRPRVNESDSRDFYDTPEVMDAAFDADWAQVKVARLVKDADQREAIRVCVKQWFPLIRETFRLYCSLGGDPFSMSMSQFTEFRKDCGIDDIAKTAELDNVFVATNYELNRSAVNPNHALMRFEFVEAIVRLGLVMFPADRFASGGAGRSVRLCLDRHIVPCMTSLFNLPNSNDVYANVFRARRLYTAEVDAALQTLRPQLQSLFEMFSGRFAEPSDVKYFVSFDEWTDMIEGSGVMTGPFVRDRHTTLAFLLSNMTVVDEHVRDRNAMKRDSHCMLSWIEFLEAMCRLADTDILENDGAKADPPELAAALAAGGASPVAAPPPAAAPAAAPAPVARNASVRSSGMFETSLEAPGSGDTKMEEPGVKSHQEALAAMAPHPERPLAPRLAPLVKLLLTRCRARYGPNGPSVRRNRR